MYIIWSHDGFKMEGARDPQNLFPYQENPLFLKINSDTYQIPVSGKLFSFTP